ncbi:MULTISPECIES: hypothetical protein [Sporosarcina]|uniref:hypothetical protein n=1 Tax=Sporosarcina TaxID=1569 RepID=UPI00059128B3|nr:MULTISPECIES: hypothetical protein [Sporosarcina]WJY29046.1 hypothetical protein QWT68_00495 [Sporosarcina sp. 0.2-SM1T-5]
MSLAGYIGCMKEIPLSGDGSEDLLIIGPCFSSPAELRNVKECQFSTPYVYEVSSDWGIEISEHTDTAILDDSKMKLSRLCELMDQYLETGEFFEHYTCWVGEECDKREGEVTLPLNNFDMDRIRMPEKTLVRFVK